MKKFILCLICTTANINAQEFQDDLLNVRKEQYFEARIKSDIDQCKATQEYYRKDSWQYFYLQGKIDGLESALQIYQDVK